MSFETPLPPFNASDPAATFVSASCMELMMIELVPMAYRMANEAETAGTLAGHKDAEKEKEELHQQQERRRRESAEGGSRTLDEDEERDAVFYRLESLGYRVGQGLVERFSRDRPRFTDTLDVIKFLCKDLWMLVFRKQIDNLKTNHRGVYVLTDNSFRPFSRMSTEPGGQAVARAQPFLWFPCGVIRGSLAAMGINATVQAESSELPGATFQIKSVIMAPGAKV